jgi:hypothetical protein
LHSMSFLKPCKKLGQQAGQMPPPALKLSPSQICGLMYQTHQAGCER